VIERAQPEPGTDLCGVDEIADGKGRVFTWGNGKESHGIIVLRWAGAVCGYVNVCPHFQIPLDHRGAVTTFAEFVLCSQHYAAFRITDGVCVEGPCEGAALTAVPLERTGGRVRFGCDRSSA
jgi:nitrite reductase/ring-hydroxylating ferredoxin subunit